jgi:tRNA threonylcarbamoyladenosine biosynthesis protein TsaE
MLDAQPALAILASRPADTQRVGAALARLLRPGDTVLLGGELGAGKTTFTQGLATALGVTEPVTSPTFVLVHSYRTGAGWDLLHADVWRLKQLQEVIDLAIPELLDEGAVAVVEWGELAAPVLPADCLYVSISFRPAEAGGSQDSGSHDEEITVSADGARQIEFRAVGPSWPGRVPQLSVLTAS